MIRNLNIDKILFLDIETAAQHPDYENMNPEWKELWNKKAAFLGNKKEDEKPSSLYARAGIYAEFGKVICVSLGYIKKVDGENQWKKLSIYNTDERILLHDLTDHLKNLTKSGFVLCAHNGKEFDYPFLARRIVINGLELPESLRIAGKKPWEVNLLDTMELWKFGDYKSYTSLNLLAGVFGIPTPKDDIDGSQVNDIFWRENDLERIVKYCEKDVRTVAEIMIKFLCEKPIVVVEQSELCS